MSLRRELDETYAAEATCPPAAPTTVPATAVHVYQQAVRYEYSCLPPGHIDRRVFTLFVQERSDGRWCVTDGTGYLTLSDIGQWDYAPHITGVPAIALPVQQDQTWLDHHRFDLPTAQSLALAHAPRIRVNGRTAADLLH